MTGALSSTQTVWTVRSALAWGTEQLARAGLSDPSIESNALMSGLLNCSLTQVYMAGEQKLSVEQKERFEKWIARRAQFEPVAYIQKVQNFMGQDFTVDARVLIPRPETELLAERAVSLLGMRDDIRILEVGTGSGCIAGNLALQLPRAKILAVDISTDALAVAGMNVQKHNVSRQVTLRQSNIVGDLGQEFHSDFDMIISNPPYVSDSEMPDLAPDLTYEPKMALCGGVDGLDVLTPLIKDGIKFLKEDGFLLTEIGYQQRARVEALMRETGFINIQSWTDDAGRDRMVCGRAHGSI